MKPVGKGMLAVAIVGGLAALVVATKPGPGPARVIDRPAAPVVHSEQQDHHPTSSGTTAAAATATTSATAAESPSAMTTGDSATAAIDSSWQKHGKAAVLRSATDLEPGPTGLLPPTATARWAEPTSLKFFQLKKHYRAFKKLRRFEPDTTQQLSGAAVQITGAFMPIDPIPDDGRVRRFWLANPVVVMAGCVFCSPPTMADLIYVTTDKPVEVDRETLFRGVLMLELLGRLRLGPRTTDDGVQYLFGLELRERIE